MYSPVPISAALIATTILWTTTNAAQLQMASVGSSYAAGPGLKVNYPHLIAAKLNANLTDRSKSGSLLKDIASQISGIPANADIVTLTSGGNDLGYVAALSIGVAPANTVSQEDLTGRFTRALDQIHKVAPGAKVYLVEYLTMLGPDTKAGVDVPFNANTLQKIDAVFQKLKAATEAARVGREEWVTVVPVTSASTGHALGSKADVWVNGAKVRNGAGGTMWHPNTVGTQAVADLTVASIQGGDKEEEFAMGGERAGRFVRSIDE